MLVELLARDARLDHAIEILRVHRQHAVHVAKIDRHAAIGRIDVAFERGARAEGNDRDASLAQMRTMSCTSSVACGKTTASGGSLAIQLVVLACCSRTAREVTSRLPNFAASAATAASIELGSRRVIRSDFSCTNAIANSRRAGM